MKFACSLELITLTRSYIIYTRSNILINISQILHTFHKHDSNPFTLGTVAQIFPKIALGNELALALRGWNRESGVITLISKLCVLSPERYIRVPAPVGNAHGNIRTVL